ncbi:hypothetical protein CHLRE_21g751947v5 [Chlamydomonas reinhardtii]|uniref:Uncharacterized protein n=1 Tax=Chlamydomonas reinhardtii TaxID=3055 RepID=A0A2K3CN92_CHLRE|nr:uncharacterized protein CHLRE_21g751947v5 [Chlamydomonas reinhardtii]PNW69746.1 hypothetical protein CHLRE_21g751947v5 [Chlamydomonas reinhardtii]
MSRVRCEADLESARKKPRQDANDVLIVPFGPMSVEAGEAAEAQRSERAKADALLGANMLLPPYQGRLVVGSTSVIARTMAHLRARYAFVPIPGQTKLRKVYACETPACNARMEWVAKDATAKAWLVLHSPHSHAAAAPTPTATPGQLTREGQWCKLRPDLDALGVKLDANGIVTHLKYALAPPKPPSAHLVEVMQAGAIRDILMGMGWAALPEQQVRVFDIDLAAADALALEALQGWARIAGVALQGEGQKLVRRQQGLSTGGDKTSWYQQWFAECPFGLLDVTGQDVLVCAVRRTADGGLQRAPLVSVGQVSGEARRALRNKVARTCQEVHNGDAWAHIDKHYDGNFWMAGLASPARVGHIICRYVNQIIYECEAEHYPFGIEEALEEMCTAVWEAAVQVAPYLTKYRDEFLSAWGRQAMYGDTATNLVSMTKNCAVSLHFDTTDGPYSIMLWRHNGAGSLDGGHFLMPGASIKVLPTDMTIVVLAAGMVTHGTAPVLESTGEARRYGYSHFLRVPAMERVARLIKASGGKKKMEELQVQGMKRVLAARTAADRKARRDEIQKQRDELLKSALDGEALPEGEHLAFAVRGLKWHRDIVKCLVWQDFKGKS